IVAASPARAQDSDDLQRAVARISLMDGQVSVKRGDSGDWVAGIINAPLMSDDRIATGPNSRAEVQLDSSNLFRIGGNGEINLAALEYGRYQIQLAKGTLTFRVLRPSQANIEVDTPTVSVRPSQVGAYRISVTDAGETEVTARAGNVEVFTPRGSQWVNAGQSMMARGSSSDPEFQIVSAIPLDEWDHWNEGRDRIFTQPSPTGQYIDPNASGIYGTEQLDNYGSWVSVPDYGYVWHPTAVGVGWAPYSYGQWTWLDWYGWTWVSYDPWGWAPFHYGRWFWGGGYGWCWYPGVWGVRHYWSPALVAWLGYGGGVGFGFGFGHVGWVPLAPYETFHPWWGRGFYGGANFNRNINVTNVNVTNIYRNARVPNGVSGVAAADFRGGHFGSIAHVTNDQLRTAGLVRGQMPIAPTAANLHYSNRQSGFTPQAASNTRFFSRQQASLPQRIPFAQQQRTMDPSSARTMNQTESPRAAGNQARGPSNAEPNVNRPGVNPGGSSGWRRFGEPAAPQRNEANSFRGNQAPSTQNTRPPQAQGGNGWQRFGNPGAGSPGNTPRQAPRYDAPSYSAPRYNAPSQPRYNAPAPSAPRSAPAPSYSAPRGGGGGGGARSSGGGGHSGGGGGGHHR
ncbi:MAG TPA: DUF6600 domain-containing protein, partial [Candidatus Sulfopaludibacter sp.]|nr:DUF6600 domain-containing protein [Candidatus Sulfopaludibacter sp.]